MTATVRVLAASSGLTGAILFVGWFVDPAFVLSMSGDIAVRVTTAFGLAMLGAMLWAMEDTRAGGGDTRPVGHIVVSTCALWTLLITGLLLVAGLMKMSLGVERLFVSQQVSGPFDVGLGIPSLGTLTALSLAAVAGLCHVFNSLRRHARVRALGYVVSGLGGSALIGHALDVPALFFFSEGLSTGMAALTAACLVAQGVALVLVGRVP